MRQSCLPICLWLVLCLTCRVPAKSQVPEGPHLPDTQPLMLDEPLDVVMVRGINLFAERELAAVAGRRAMRWDRDVSSEANYLASVAPYRQRLRELIGAVDQRVPRSSFWTGLPAATIDNSTRIDPFRVDVLPGVTVEGLRSEQPGRNRFPPRNHIILIPDAGQTPEMLFGIEDGLEEHEQLGRILTNSGAQVIIPQLIDLGQEHSGHPNVRWTNLTHREYAYRLSFELGRHVLGYEVQKIASLLDYVGMDYERTRSVFPQSTSDPGPVIVWGIGEGGLLAMLVAALDERVDLTIVSGHFQEREHVWREPIYRNVWNLLTEFGDAEIASLIAPRRLIIEDGRYPEVAGPPMPLEGRSAIAAPGRLVAPSNESVERELSRLAEVYRSLGVADHLQSFRTREHLEEDSQPLLEAVLSQIGLRLPSPARSSAETASHHPIPLPMFEQWNSPDERRRRQVGELVRYSQSLLHASDKVRDQFWAAADRSSLDGWMSSTGHYRNHIHEVMIGRLPVPDTSLHPRSRMVIDEPTHTGYEVVLDVYPPPVEARQEPVPESEPTGIANGRNALDHTVGPDWGVIAGGILLIPRDLRPGERRPVVVCQHGLEGTPMSTITTDETSRDYAAYKGFSTALVERGFIVYAPQNPYRGLDDFRVIQRKSNPLGRSLFSYIIEQHRQTLRWLATLPYVDADRIAFYGLSYGGKTAVRVPPLLIPAEGDDHPVYCLSICSADFNEWIRKNVSHEDRYSYVYTIEYEMFEWNMGHVANYAELANLMTPRPFMVERGHHDGVAPDEWVAWEFAKVRRHYSLLGLGDRTEIEWFVGPHTIHGVGTYEFLHRHLDWPAPQTAGP